MIRRKIRSFIMLTFAFLLMCILFTAMPGKAQAAGLKSRKPVFNNDQCGYVNTQVYLKWKKVKGASKYQVYRAKTAGGKYKKVATTKKTYYKKKIKGTWYYKVRAVKGKKKSKFSVKKHFFGARGKITQMFYDPTYGTTFRLLINNRTSSAMNFYYGSQYCTVWLVNKKTGKPVGSCYGYLYCPGGNGKRVAANKTQSIYVYTYYNLNRYGSNGLGNKNYYYMITYTFYAGGYRFALGVNNRYSGSGLGATTAN